jgi:tetratricopeptide (TPR) repeat protein
MRPLHAASLSLLLLLGAACRAPTSPASGPTTAESQALALTAPAGDGAADREILRLQENLRRSPSADDWVLLGQAWIRKARQGGDSSLYLSAEGSSAAALRMRPGHHGALALRAMVLLNQHRFGAAREQALAILAGAPDDVPALAALSDAALEMGDVAAALEATQRLVDLKPGLASYGRAAHLRWIQGDVDGAKQLYARAIDAGRGGRDPEPVAWMLVQAALIFWNVGDVEGALAGAQQALALVPRHGPALVLEARCRLARGEDAEAVRLLEQAEAVQPLVETGWLLADARRRLGDESGAQHTEARLLRQGRQSDPLMVGLFLASRGRNAGEAVRLIEAEHRARPGLLVEDAYAWALYRAGKLGEARAAIDRATAHGTPDPRLLYHAGAIRLAQGDAEAGKALIQRALGLNPQFDPVGSSEARALLGRSEREARRR